MSIYKTLKITIRDYKPEDHPQVAKLSATSFRKDWNKLVKLPDNDMALFLIDVGEVMPYPFKGYLVAENEGEIVGVMILKWAKQKVPKTKFKLSKVVPYGLYTTVKLIAMRYLFPENPKKGVCHVAELAVIPGAQRKGIGTKLIAYGREMAQKQGLAKYALHVDAENEPALKLYEKMGFRLVKKKKHILARWLLGIKEWYFMSQDIDAVTTH